MSLTMAFYFYGCACLVAGFAIGAMWGERGR
jgi:hypothetical protein